MKKIKKSQVSQLWEQYLKVKFRCTENILPSFDFMILTAYNPRSQVQQQIINRIKQQKLTTYLMAHKMSFTPILCGNDDFSYCEPSLAVQIDQKKALNLAVLYGQNAFYQISDGELSLVPALIRDMPTQEMGLFSDYLMTE